PVVGDDARDCDRVSLWFAGSYDVSHSLYRLVELADGFAAAAQRREEHLYRNRRPGRRGPQQHDNKSRDLRRRYAGPYGDPYAVACPDERKRAYLPRHCKRPHARGDRNLPGRRRERSPGFEGHGER